MNKIEDAELTMQRKTDVLLTENQIRFVLMTVFVSLKARLVAGIAMVDSLASKKDECKKKSKAPKVGSRKLLIKYVIKTTSQLRAFAKNGGDIDLVDLVKITPSELGKMTDNALVHFTDNILKYTTEHLASLDEYGVTAQTVTDGETLLLAYKSEIDKLAAIQKESKRLTVDVRLQLKVNEATLELIDSLVDTQSETDPSWSGLYFDTRTVLRSASSRVSVSGKVFAADTNQPLRGAILTVLNAVNGQDPASGAELVKSVKIKSARGGFRIKSLPTGTYLMKVTYAGYVDLEITVYINEGVLTKVEFPMIQIAQ